MSHHHHNQAEAARQSCPGFNGPLIGPPRPRLTSNEQAPDRLQRDDRTSVPVLIARVHEP